MEEQAMLARDLVLRVCAGATEFDPHWLRAGDKVTAPFAVPRDRNLIRGIVEAGRAMGVDRLLVCRTRAEFSYDPVTEVPLDTGTLIDLIRGWGPTPTDFLVCVEDFSAAVLVASNELTVAAGPADFVREIVGPDIARARTDFARRALEGNRPELLRAAQHYNCADPGDRHGRGGRGPGPDLAERLTRRAERVRERSPGLVRFLRGLRGTWGWLMLGTLFLVPLAVPALGAALPALVLTCLLLFQLALLARSRTVSFATLLRTAALGALLLWPIAFLSALVSGALGLETNDVFSRTYVAVTVEELGKLTPLLLLLLLARRRMRRLAAVDFLLLAAATGAGFQLAEQLLYGIASPLAGAEPGAGLILPGSTTGPGLGGVAPAVFAGHAVVTGLIGATLGLAIVGRRYGGWLWLLPVLATGLVFLDHLHLNAQSAAARLDPVSTFVHGVLGSGALTPWLLLLALVFAVAMDYRLIASAAETTPPLPGRAPLPGLRRWAHGRSVAMRVRVPADIAPLFRRIALSWADLPVTLTTALTTVVHELATATMAAKQGPGALCDALRFLRWRRANAMGEARSRGRSWRRYPSQEELAGSARDLARRIGLAGTGGVVVAAASLLALPRPAAGAPLGSATVSEVPPAYAVYAVDVFQDWFAGADPATASWTALTGLAVLSLLTVGNAVPRAHPRMGEFLRAPTSNTGAVLGMLAPGQVGYAVLGLTGMLLPRRVNQLLIR